MRRTPDTTDRRVSVRAATAGVVLAAALAGWAGSTVALGSVDTTPAAASDHPAGALPTGGPAASASASTPSAAPRSATTTQPTTPPPSAPAATVWVTPSPAGRTSPAPPQPSGPPAPAVEPAPPVMATGTPDIVFVSPSPDSGGREWYYSVGLLGFPADTVVEISGQDTYRNAMVAPIVLTTADGSWNPYATGFRTMFAYGGTCDDATPTTVTARGRGLSVTETTPRPLECDGGSTPSGPWPLRWSPPAVPMTPSPHPVG